MRLERKMTLAVLGLFAPPTAAAGLILLFLYRRGLLEEPRALVTAVLLGLAAMMAYLALVARGLGASLVRTIEELRHGAELMATVNPDRRLEIRTGDELEALAREINLLADRLRLARDGLGAQVDVETRALQAERSRLATVLDGLVDGIVVVGSEGRILLANPAARRLLNGGCAVLGAPLTDFVGRDSVAPYLARPAPASARPARLVVETNAGEPLHATLAPILDQDPAGGFVLVLRDPASGVASGPPVPGPATPGRSGQPAPRLVGMGLRSGTATHVPGPAPSDLYDFSLLDEMERRIGPAARDRRLDELSFVVFDTETTGLWPEAGDRVVSLAGVRVDGMEVRRQSIFDALVHPGRPVPLESVRFHGITDDDLAGAPSLGVVLPAFLGFLGDAVLVGHEVAFDLGFLAPEAVRLGLPPLTVRPALDIRLLSRSLHGPAVDHSLEAAALRLGVAVVGRHSALGDALTAAEIFVRLLALLKGRGVETLGDLLEASRRGRTPIA
jgi:DNA polymerase III epsilon subunit-like protein/PAS domain-containing protein